MAEEFESMDSVVVANAIRALAKEKNIDVNMTKIHKLLYISYGVLLARKNIRLTKEHPQAWPFGPVFPRVHKHVSLDTPPPSLEELSLPEIAKKTICDVLDVFGKFSAGKLSAWSHKSDSPWDKTVKENNGKWGCQMNDEYISAFFKRLIKA